VSWWSSDVLPGVCHRAGVGQYVARMPSVSHDVSLSALTVYLPLISLSIVEMVEDGSDVQLSGIPIPRIRSMRVWLKRSLSQKL